MTRYIFARVYIFKVGQHYNRGAQDRARADGNPYPEIMSAGYVSDDQ